MKRKTTTFLKLSIGIIGILILILCIYWLPLLAKNAAEMIPEYAYLRYPILIGMYITAIPFYLALYQAHKLLSYIESKNAFSELAVDSLKHIKHYGDCYKCVFKKEDKKNREVQGSAAWSTKESFYELTSHAGKVVFFSKERSVCF